MHIVRPYRWHTITIPSTSLKTRLFPRHHIPGPSRLSHLHTKNGAVPHKVRGTAPFLFILGNTAQFPPCGLSTAPAAALPKCSIMSGCGTRIVLRGQKPLALCDRCPCFGSLFPPLAALTFAASSIICAFGLASAVPRSPYRHLELCGIALRQYLFLLAGAYIICTSPQHGQCVHIGYFSTMGTVFCPAAFAWRANCVILKCI